MANWRRRRISDLVDGLTAGVSVRSTSVSAGKLAVLKTSSINNGKFLPSESKPILAADNSRARINPEANSLIISRMNTPALVGDVGYVSRTYPELFLPDRLWLARPRPESGVNMRWLTYYLASEPGAMKLRELASGTSGSMKNIPKDRVLNLELDLPSQEEQLLIAESIGAADDQIDALERLISKKQAIRQGLVQELFSGKTRLPGFSESWTTTTLRDQGSTYGGLTGKSGEDFGAGAAQYVTFMEVIGNARLLGKDLGRVRLKPNERQNRVMRGDLLFNGSSETPEEVALSAVVDFDPSPFTYLNSFCFGYRLNRFDRADPAFLAYYFRSASGRKLVSTLAQGATRYNIAKTKLVEMPFQIPPLGEQRAIVQVLTDAELEIESLRRRLAKAKAIKQGMMQELLTGRIRLVSSEVVS